MLKFMFGKKKTTEERIKEKIKSRLSKNVATIVNDNLKKHILFDTDEKLPIHPADSKSGGSPHLISEKDVPFYENRPLKLLAQINCKDLLQLQDFPHEGMLYVFLDLEDHPTKFPEKKGQFKIFYYPSIEQLIPVKQELTSFSGLTETRIVPVEYISCIDFDSYLLDGIEISDEDADQLIDIKWGVIPEVNGKEGIYSIGSIPAMKASYEWAYQYLGCVNADGSTDWSKTNDSDIQEKTLRLQKDMVSIFRASLDELGHPDSWIHIGMHIDDLRKKSFDKVFAAFIAT
jgi:hypothetical protein